jgi:hypothetical protein
MSGNVDWQAGDFAYISGEPTEGALSQCDIVRVTNVDSWGKPWSFGRCLVAHGRVPLRLVRVGEVIPKGAVTRVILADMTLGVEVGLRADLEHNAQYVPRVFVSLPTPTSDPNAVLRERLERAEAEIRIVKQQLGEEA